MIKIGDTIQDTEDGGCYFEGIVKQLKPLKYQVTRVVWNGKIIENDEYIGKVIGLQWWQCYLLIDGDYKNVL